MPVVAKLAGFLALLAIVLGGGAVAGGAIDPDPPGDRVEGSNAGSGGHGGSMTANNEDADGGGHGAMAQSDHPVRGLAVAEGGLRLTLDNADLRRGVTETVRFRILDNKQRPIRDFDLSHAKRMHVIVVRRDTTNFQHLHPTMAADGTWSLPVRVTQSGSYRLFADFERDGQSFTLATDLRVDGDAQLRDLPAVEPIATTDDGYEVRLAEATRRAGKASTLRFTITKDGHGVQTEPYLGAGGHLVALREGDLAFLHVHPLEHSDDAAQHDDTPSDDESHAATEAEPVAFEATFPTTGRYRLFLQFKHEGRVHTAAFTQEVR